MGGTAGPKMKRRPDSVKIIQDMRQISTFSGLYTVGSSGRIPPMQLESRREDGGYDKSSWNLLLLAMAFPDVGYTKLRDVSWWTSNRPFMLHPRIINDPKSGKFKADKSGYGMNKNLRYTYNNSSNDINYGQK